MLERLDSILVAVEDEYGAFDIYELGAERFRSAMRESRSGGGDPKVQVVQRREAEQHGTLIGRFSAQEVQSAGGASSQP